MYAEKPIWEILKGHDVNDETTREIEALGWRAKRADEQQVVDAVATVMCALQGYWKRPEKEILAQCPDGAPR